LEKLWKRQEVLGDSGGGNGKTSGVAFGVRVENVV